MPRNVAGDSRELGLELGLLALRFFAGTEELHYGLWDGLDVRLENLPAAQKQYTENLVAHIPDEAGAVLDVGCGTGVVASRLLERGHEVECVSPSAVLADRAAERLGSAVPIHRCTFQALEVERQFDVVLFSESFQYIPMDESLPRAKRLLRPGGVIVICDFFRTDAPGRGPLGGGHRYRDLPAAVEAAGLRIRHEEDLTDRIAPSMGLFEQCSRELLQPGAAAVSAYSRRRHPWVSALLARLFRRRLAKFQRKYLSGERNEAAFRHWKTYRLLVLEPG
ncbi:methyltransferase domain-containing protein [Ectothiorhodospiraceae bacterium WFHF3C12]|nr:methyltransferase domain-containing protein [Ectothiorhodospiraceae bacterium WFHF3C12]